MPMKNSNVLDMTSGKTSFFSWVYKPGATNAQTWYSTTGRAIRNAAISVIFSGTTNGEITLVAISVAPAGNWATSGAASMSYRPLGPGQNASAAKQMPTAIDARISRSRNSIRCETNGCSLPSSSSGRGSLALIGSSDHGQTAST